MSKPIIAIPGWMNENKTSFGVSRNYLDYISRFGTPRILMPGEEYYPVDMLFLPGGQDLTPENGTVPSFFTGNADVFKQWFYENRLKEYIANNTPVFGVCLGMQMLGSFFGAKLEQHMRYHEQSTDRFKTAHRITPTYEGIRMFKDMVGNAKNPYIEVNSHHHQAILSKNIGTELIPLWVAQNEEAELPNPREMKIVEVFCHAKLPIFGVQYHPEELFDEVSDQIIKTLLIKR